MIHLQAYKKKVMCSHKILTQTSLARSLLKLQKTPCRMTQFPGRAMNVVSKNYMKPGDRSSAICTDCGIKNLGMEMMAELTKA